MAYTQFTANGRIFECNKSGYPLMPRQQKRKHTCIHQKEREVIRQVRQNRDRIKNSNACRWLASRLPKLTLSMLAPLARFIAHIFEIEINSENYRKQETVLLWFDENWDMIRRCLSRARISAYHSDFGFLNFSIMPSMITSIIKVIE